MDSQSPQQIKLSDDGQTVSIPDLRAQLGTTGQPNNPNTALDSVVKETTDSLFGTARSNFEFEDSHVKTSLDEVLLAAIALRETDTHGKQLLDDIASQFDTVLSPGTVYPRLHDLCDSGELKRYTLPKTKEYSIDDTATVESKITNAARQHLAIGMALRATLDSPEFN